MAYANLSVRAGIESNFPLPKPPENTVTNWRHVSYEVKESFLLQGKAAEKQTHNPHVPGPETCLSATSTPPPPPSDTLQLLVANCGVCVVHFVEHCRCYDAVSEPLSVGLSEGSNSSELAKRTCAFTCHIIDISGEWSQESVGASLVSTSAVPRAMLAGAIGMLSHAVCATSAPSTRCICKHHQSVAQSRTTITLGVAAGADAHLVTTLGPSHVL